MSNKNKLEYFNYFFAKTDLTSSNFGEFSGRTFTNLPFRSNNTIGNLTKVYFISYELIDIVDF